jgi:hypothetical protein
MRSTSQAIEHFCSYFGGEIGEISRLVVKSGDEASEPSAASGPLYRKVLYVTMLDTLAGVRFNKKAYPDLARQNRSRFSRFILEHCSWPEAELVSVPFLLEKLKEHKLESRPLGQFVSAKLLRFSTEDGGTVAASEMDEPAAELLQHATTEKEEAAISEYGHIALLYRYRNRLVHESRQPGYAMEVFAEHPAPYYHGYLENSEWHLGYPLTMFERLVRNGLAGFRSYLEANVINPYSALDNTQRW